MPLDFPSSPTNGQIYNGYYYDTASASWRSSPLTNGPAYISDTVPSGAPNGGMWYNSSDGTMFVKYNGSWVEARSNPKIIPGSVVQVKHLTYTTQTSASANSLRMPIPNFYVDITPKFANSRMIVITHLSMGFSNTPEWSWFVDRTIGAGSPVQLGTPAYDGNRMNGYHGGPRDGSATNWTVETESFSHTVEDVPGTLDSCRYQVCFQNRWSNNALFYLNRSGDYPNTGYVNSGSSSITVMEVAQ